MIDEHQAILLFVFIYLSAFPFYLQLVELHLFGGEIVEPGAAFLHRQLRDVQALLKRLGAGLEVFHLSQKVLDTQREREEIFFTASGDPAAGRL